MSGVIDDDGTQWEHCNVCRKFVRIQDLEYEDPSPEHKYGLDLCPKCASGRQTRNQAAAGLLLTITLPDTMGRDI